MTETIFEVKEDNVDGGYIVSALGFGIHAEADTLDDLRKNPREALDCYFDEKAEAPRMILLHVGSRRCFQPKRLPPDGFRELRGLLIFADFLIAQGVPPVEQGSVLLVPGASGPAEPKGQT